MPTPGRGVQASVSGTVMNIKKNGPAITINRAVIKPIGAARFVVVGQTFAAGKVLATSCRRATGETFEREARDHPIRVAVHALTCIHAHFGDFTCVQLRSFLLISLQLRLQLAKRSARRGRGRST